MLGLREGNGNPLQYLCLENPMDGGGHLLSDFTFTFHFHALEEEMATHSSVLAWRIPGTGEPGGLPSVGLHRVGHDWSNLAAAAVLGLPMRRLSFYDINDGLKVTHFLTAKPKPCPDSPAAFISTHYALALAFAENLNIMDCCCGMPGYFNL